MYKLLFTFKTKQLKPKLWGIRNETVIICSDDSVTENLGKGEGFCSQCSPAPEKGFLFLKF
jgi:hypothetical protein